MSFNFSFDATAVAPAVEQKPLPTAVYDVVITSTEDKLVKDGDGKAFWLIEMQVINGEYAQRKIYDRLNYKNPNEDARRMAQASMSALCHVTGIMYIRQSSQELHNRPFKVSVAKVKRQDDPTKETNEIRGYLDIYGFEPGKNPGVAGAAAAPGGWGQQPAAQQAAPAAQQQQAWQQPSTAAPVAQAQQTAAPVATQQSTAVDPRLIALLTAGLSMEQAQAALATPAPAVQQQAAPAQNETPAWAGIAPQAANPMQQAMQTVSATPDNASLAQAAQAFQATQEASPTPPWATATP